MTMPSKIWAGYNSIGMSYFGEQPTKSIGDTPYIRADIAEELARALEHMVAQFQHPDQMSDDALAKYRTITP